MNLNPLQWITCLNRSRDWSVSGATCVTCSGLQFNIRSMAKPVKAFPHNVCSLTHREVSALVIYNSCSRRPFKFCGTHNCRLSRPVFSSNHRRYNTSSCNSNRSFLLHRDHICRLAPSISSLGGLLPAFSHCSRAFRCLSLACSILR